MDDSSLKVQRCADPQFVIEYEQLRKAVFCPICITSCKEPLCLSCGHTFCKDCINTALSVKEICPLCSTVVSRRKLADSSPAVTELFSMLSEFVAALEPSSYNQTRTTEFHVPTTALVKVPTIAVKSTEAELNDVPQDLLVSEVSVPFKEPVADSAAILMPGILVNVLPRTWAGINKLGGIGWITKAHYNEGSFVPCDYDVKYVLDSTTDTHIPAAFVEAHKELDRTSRRSRTSAASPAPTSAPNSSSKSVKNSSNPNSASKSSGKKRKATSSSTSPTSSDPPVPVVILTTAVAPECIEKLGQLSAKFPHVSMATQFSPSVTHVIVTVDRNGVLKKRTMKYMQALLGGLWILSSSWVEACQAKMKMVPELPHEVKKNSKAELDNAPQRARVYVQKMKQKAAQSGSLSGCGGSCFNNNLFSQCSVLLFGQFPTPGPPRSDTEALLAQGGATVTCKLEVFLDWVEAASATDASSATSEETSGAKTGKHRRYLVVVCQDSDVLKEFLSVIPESVRFKVGNERKVPHEQRLISVVAPVWAFDSITNYDFQKPSLYEIE